MLRPLTRFALTVALCAAASFSLAAYAAQEGGAPQKSAETKDSKSKDKPQPKAQASKSEGREFTAEQVVEGIIIAYGSRPALEQIRRNGVEAGRLTRMGADGRTEEASYVRRFVRGASSDKDKVRLDQRLPTLEYSLVYGEGRTWGIINGSVFTPRQEATVEFQSQLWHGIDALLRYKENGSTVSLVGKDKQQGVEFYIIDLVDKEKRRTRYYASTRTLRVMWLEYEEASPVGGPPVKFMRRFYDYRPAQGTLVPYRTVFYEDGKQSQETRVMTVTYGVKMEDSLFQNPDAPRANSNAARQ